MRITCLTIEIRDLLNLGRIA